MYFYIKGKIKYIQKNSIILENNDIGYNILFSNPHIFNLNQEIKLFTYFYIVKDKQFLYGFLDIKTMDFFKKLISFPGVGPKSALIMSNTDFFQEIKKAIETNNIKYLIQFPNIGPKIAEQIIFYFRKKTTIVDQNRPNLTSKQKDTEQALINLGFRKKEITCIIQKLDSMQSLENMIKDALKLLNQ